MYYTDISTKYRDDGFLVDLGYFGHFHGTQFVRGGSQLDRLEGWKIGSQLDRCLREQERKQEVTGSVEMEGSG